MEILFPISKLTKLTHFLVVHAIEQNGGSEKEVNNGSDLSSLGENVGMAVPPVASADSTTNASNALVALGKPSGKFTNLHISQWSVL